MKAWFTATSIVMLAASTACESATDEPDLFSGSGSGIDEASTEASSDATAGGSGSGARLDMLDEGGSSEGQVEAGSGPGCTKVDLLFVIDDSISMAGEQANLVASFPEFISGIQAKLPDADSYHVGVVTTNAYAFNTPECQTIGALVTQTGGASSSAGLCGPFSEGRYMTELADLEQGFSCAAQVGIDGPTDERPMQAMQVAIGPAHAGAGGCNEGFMRDDALLVVVVITDEEDDPREFYGELEGSPGDPAAWFDAVVAAKGVETNAAVLTIIGGEPGNVCPEPNGVDGAEDAPRLRAFTERFTYGFTGDVCAPSYGPFFEEAIAVVEDACDTFQPVD